ncbi:MAG: HlyC/CorC family transporter [Planctomycetes bacterium]|nr:HlyC/CorC family transporter [Planctomycetota bacterium]
MTEPLTLAVFAALSLVAALFHRALCSASPARLEELNDKYRSYDKLPDIDDATATAGALKIGVYAVLVSFISIRTFAALEGATAAYIAAVAASVAALAVCEAVALVGAGHHSGRMLYRVLPLVSAFSSVGTAMLTVGGALGGFFARLLGREAPLAPDEAAEEEMLDAVSEGERQGVIEDQEREMIESIIEFKDVEVAEVMTPRTELTSLSGDTNLQETIPTIVASGHSRLPVWSENADNIVGVLYVKDILQHIDTPGGLDATVRSVMRAPYFVPETKMVNDLLQEFRAMNIHMAIVLDEYGGTSGIVTIEDILEEIVGEIEDEFDGYEPPDISSTGEGRAFVAGHTPIDEVNKALGTTLSENDEYETIAGYVLFRTGRIPRPGETFEWEGAGFRILEADERHIEQLTVEVSERADGHLDRKEE